MAQPDPFIQQFEAIPSFGGGPLSNAAAAPAGPVAQETSDFEKAFDIDPNTGNAPTQVPTVGTSLGKPETYTDEWAKAPTGTPPVRTWVDPAAQDRGEFAAAWYDTPVTGVAMGTEELPKEPAPAPTVQPAAPAATPAPRYRVSYNGPTDSSDGLTTVMDQDGKVVHTMSGTDGNVAFGNRGEITQEELMKSGWNPPAAVPAATTPAATTAPVQPPL